VKDAGRRVIVIGGGHNGLVCAALLARSGLRPVVLERRERAGGAAVTEEFHPGFRVSSVAHLAGPFRPALAAELGLAAHGLVTVEPEPRLFAPLPDGRSLRLWGNAERSAAEIHRLSPRDANRYPELHRSMRAIAAVLSRLRTSTPPDLERTRPADLASLLGLGRAARRLDREDASRLLRWLSMPVADFAAEWFETDVLRAVLAAGGVRGVLAGPRSPGTTANLLLRSAAQDGNPAAATVIVRGGLGALADALVSVARARGAEVRTGALVERVVVRDGRAVGVVLAGGEAIDARAVVSNADPRRTLDLLDPAVLDPEDQERLRHFRQRGCLSKVHLALSSLPTFTAVGREDAVALLGGRIHLAPDPDTIERAFDAAKYGTLPAQPLLEVTIPSLVDPTLAPRGAHVLSAVVQYTPYALRGATWPSRRADVAEATLRTLEVYAPGIRGLVLHAQVITPADLESTYGLTGGHGDHGEHALDQLFVGRPLVGWSRYRTPIPGFYLCGAGTHPGGGVTGECGANAAREVLRDLR
jgi:phytoene dehydrogenase-like protein